MEVMNKDKPVDKIVEENKIAELLKPRFKLIADYPGNTNEIGNITTEIATASYFRKFPANFKELFWWQERKEDEMPHFLKYATPKYSAKPFVVYPAKFTKEKEGWTVQVEKTIIPHGNYLNDKLPANQK